MIRFFDILLSLIGIFFLLPLLIIIFVIGLFENRSPLFIQSRVGKYQKNFKLIKFRTMSRDTLSKPTHLINKSATTNFGKILRYTKLDETPQLWNVLIGDMSLVGPRPCLPSQKKLIRERKKKNVFKVKPGITGLSQISGITMKTPSILARTDIKMIKKNNLYYYFYYIFKTITYVILDRLLFFKF